MKNTWMCTVALVSVMARAGAPVGATPPLPELPTIEFAFEERVTLAPPVVQGNTALGFRQFIPITGGSVAGPLLKGQVLSGGWDYQLTYSASQCTQLSASYFLKAEDGTLIHVLNEGLVCPGMPRTIFHPKLEAPKGPWGWMTNAMFVATLELEKPVVEPPPGAPLVLDAVRIRIYLVK